jgi:hypothetical protein
MISEEDDPYGSEWMGKKGISGDEREREILETREREVGPSIMVTSHR